MEIALKTSSFFLSVIIFLHEGGRLFVIYAICELTSSEVRIDERLNHASFLQGSRYVCETNPCK